MQVEYLSIFMFLSFTFCYVTLFEKKLIVLLSLEGLMLCSIFCYVERMGSLIFCFFLFYMAIFMVVDSVLGLSVFINKSRASGVSAQSYSNI